MRWQEEKRLGRRGPFEVWAAWPTGTAVQQAVLLQRLAAGVQVHPRQLQAYLQEQRTLAAHPHPAMLRVLEAGTQQGRLYLVSEYPHGRSLAGVLGRMASRGLPGPLLLGILERLAAALQAAHRLETAGRPLVHGWLGPGQVVIGFDGKVKVRDFALYRLLGGGGERGGVLLAPEQRAGSSPDRRSDVFALGRLAQELLLLTPQAEPPAGLSELLQKMTEREPRQRPGDLEPLCELLQGAGMAEDDLRRRLASWLHESEPERPAETEEAAAGEDELLDPAAFWQAAAEAAEQRGEPEPGERPGPGLMPGVPEPAPVAAAPEQESAFSRLPPAAASRPASAGVASKPARPRRSPAPGAAKRAAARPARARPPAASGRSSRPTLFVALAVLVAGGVLAFMVYRPDEPPAAAPRTRPAAVVPHKIPAKVDAGSLVTPKTNQAQSDPRGRLVVESDPAGAVVYIDDRKQGVTPTVVRRLELGREVTLRLELDEYRPWVTRLRPTAENPRLEVRAGLFPVQDCQSGRGWLYVSSEPAGAVVEIDGRRFPGATPLVVGKLCAGRAYAVSVQAPGYRPWREEQVFIMAGQVRNLRIQLER